jgi:hypothetical protein
MATCNDIIRRAYHMAKIVPMGEAPSADEAEFGMDALKSMYDGWVEGGMFGRLTDVYKMVAYEAKEQERVITPAAVITLPTVIESVEGERAPRELSCIVTIVGGVQTSQVYHKGAWVTLNGLDLMDEAPLSDRSAFGLSAALALMIAETFQQGAVSGSVAAMARQYLGSLSMKLGATPRPSETVYF